MNESFGAWAEAMPYRSGQEPAGRGDARSWDMAFDKGKAERLLKDRGLKVTRQRMAVLEAIDSCPREHLTAEEIFELVKQTARTSGWLLFIEPYRCWGACI